MNPERSNAAWLKALNGEPEQEALEDLRAYLLRGLRFALGQRYRVTESDLEDFVQEAMVRILDNLDSFRGESRFTTWAQKIAVRVAFSELRRKRWQDMSLQDLSLSHDNITGPELDSALNWLPSPSLNPEQQVTQQSLQALLMELIQEELTDLQRRALIAVAIQGMPLEEVARRMNTNRNALYKLLHDARVRLKNRLEQRGVTVEEVMEAFSSG